MKKSLKALLAGATLALASVSASAAVWTSTYDPSPNPTITWYNSHTWTHNLTAVGYTPGTDIDWFSLDVSVYDDDRRDGDEDGYLDVKTGNVLLDLFGAFDVGFYDMGVISTGGVDFLGSLNFLEDGFVTITLKSTDGDFKMDKSVLKAGSNSVPEPASLALLGLGLAGLAVARRRQQKA
jgi:hypothetical protein